MPRMENPSVFIPGGSIVVIYPGASPSDLEQQVAEPIEESINELDDIKKINTTLLDGLASIAVEFDFETDAQEMLQKKNFRKKFLIFKYRDGPVPMSISCNWPLFPKQQLMRI